MSTRDPQNPQNPQPDRHAKGSTMVRLPPNLRDAMATLAVQNERTLAAEVRIAVRQYLEREKEKAS